MTHINHYAVLACLIIPNIGYSAPTGGVVSSGTATINQSGAITTINQSSDNATLNWTGFDVASGESVVFAQPDAQSITLNNISGLDPSTVAGSISSNGRVFLSNPNGFIFTSSSTVNVGSLLATTSSISAATSSQLTLSNNGAGSITIDGNIESSSEGFLAFFAPSIINNAELTSIGGDVALSNASNGTLYLPDSAGVGFKIDELDSLNPIGIENTGNITASGGQVILSSDAINRTLQSAINNSGIIDVSSISIDGGSIKILASQGSIDQSSNLTANSTSNNGGSIELVSDATISLEGSGLNSGNSDIVLRAATIEIEEDIRSADLTVDAAFVILSADIDSSGEVVFANIIDNGSTLNGAGLLGNLTATDDQALLLAGDSSILSPEKMYFINNRIFGDNSGLTLSSRDLYINDVDDIATLNTTAEFTYLYGDLSTRGDGITLQGGEIKLTAGNDISITAANTGGINIISTIDSEVSQDLSLAVTDGELAVSQIAGVNDLTISNGSTLTTLNGNITLRGDFSSINTSDISLNGSITIESGISSAIDLSQTNLHSVVEDSTVTIKGSTIKLGELDAGSLIVEATTALELNDDITVSTTLADSLNFSNANKIILAEDVDLVGNILLTNGTTVASIDSLAGGPARSLSITGGNQNITLGSIGVDEALQSFSLSGTGTLALALDAQSAFIIPVTSGNNGVSFLGDLTLNTSTFTINTSASNGNINLSGLNIDAAAIDLSSGSGDISIGELGKNTAIASITTSSSGTINLYGNINSKDGMFDFSTASSVILHDNIEFGTKDLAVASLLFGNANIDGNFDLDINATVLSLGAIGENIALQNLSINSGETNLNLTNNISTAGDIQLNGNLISIDNNIASTGGNVSVNALSGLTMSNTTMLSAQDGDITLAAAAGNISLGHLTALNTIDITSSAGSILNGIDDFNSNADASINLMSKDVNLTAAQSIGSSVSSPVVIDAGLNGNIDISSGGNIYIANLANSNVTSDKDLIDNTSQAFIATTDALNQLALEPQHLTLLSELAIPDPNWQNNKQGEAQEKEFSSSPRIYYSKKGWRLGNP